MGKRTTAYKGIRFYSRAGGTSWKKISAAEIAYKKDGAKSHEGTVRIGWGPDRKDTRF